MTETQPLVSVILPTHNRAQLLRRSVASVLGQSYGNLELIVIENGCTDETSTILDACEDSRLRRLRLPDRCNASKARNAGLAISRGPLVAFQDDDDIWLHGKIERQVQTLLAASVGTVMCICGHIRLLPNEIKSCCSAEDFARLDFDDGLRRSQGIIATPGWLVTRAALEQVGGFDELLPARNDWELALRLRTVGGFVHLTEPLFVQDQSRTTTMALNQAAHCAALQRIEQMHGHRWRDKPHVLAAHARFIAQYEMELGNMPECRTWLRRSLALELWRPRSWLAYLLSLMNPRLARAGLLAYRRLYVALRT